MRKQIGALTSFRGISAAVGAILLHFFDLLCISIQLIWTILTQTNSFELG
jgi:hypothetical protein